MMQVYRLLKRFRVVLSLLVLTGVTWYFTAIRVYDAQGLSLLLKMQFVPALLSLAGVSLAVLVIILLMTLFGGRVYCSLLCPMGIFQDVVIRISHLFKTKKQKRFHYHREARWVRYSVLGLTATLWMAGFTLPLLLLDPYSNYGRIASYLIKPVACALNNGLSYLWPDSIYVEEYIAGAVWGYLWTAAILLTVAGMSAVRGRLFCHTLCPVGAFLGLVSKYAAFRPVVDKNACTRCGVCGIKCKSECIESKSGTIDHSRCVACFNCMSACRQHALNYTFTWRNKSPRLLPENSATPSRRLFLTSAGTAVGAAALYRAFGGTPLTGASSPKVIAPPGARSHAHLKGFCTACQACVAACPTRIIQPEIRGYGFDGWMLPAITYKNGFCTYDCNCCSEVCPTSALERITLQEKKVTRIGKARFFHNRCIVSRDGTDCGACDEHCPTKAVHMEPFGNKGLRRPVVDEAYCIGCGGCEFICPATPKAIMVQALEVHGHAQPPLVEKQEQVEITDFGF